MAEDNWQHRGKKMLCETCMWWVKKVDTRYVVMDPNNPQANTNIPPVSQQVLGRCRRHAPTMSGWPAVFSTDWCGNHKLDETKI